MRDDELQDRLRELHEELKAARSVDDDTRRSLRRVQDDIETLLESTDDGSSDLLDRLNEAAAGFEAEHPQLSTMIARITNALAQMGI